MVACLQPLYGRSVALLTKVGRQVEQGSWKGLDDGQAGVKVQRADPARSDNGTVKHGQYHLQPKNHLPATDAMAYIGLHEICSARGQVKQMLDAGQHTKFVAVTKQERSGKCSNIQAVIITITEAEGCYNRVSCRAKRMQLLCTLQETECSTAFHRPKVVDLLG